MLFSSSGLKAQDNGVPIIKPISGNVGITNDPTIGLEPGIKGELDCDDLPDCVKDLEKLICLIGNTASVSVLTSGPAPILLPMPDAATTPQNVVISENLVVDIDYTFAPGSTIVVLEDVAIKVLNGKKLTILDGSILRGCLKMWQGVFVDYGGSLEFKGVTVEDAFRGVNMLTNTGSSFTGSNVSVVDCTFNLCLVGVSLGDESGDFAPIRKINVAISGIKNNIFNGGGVLKTNPGNFPEPFVGLHINSIRPITILNCTFQNYGQDPNNISSDYVTRGVSVTNCSPRLIVCNFENIGILAEFLPSSRIGSAISVFNPPSQNLRIWQGSAHKVGAFISVVNGQFGNIESTGVTIEDVAVGYNLTGIFILPVINTCKVDISGGSISNFRDNGIRVIQNSTINTSSLKITGVSFNDNKPSCPFEGFSPPLFRQSIFIDCEFIQSNNVQITDNIFLNSDKNPTLCDGLACIGIRLEKCKKSIIANNHFTDNHITSSDVSTLYNSMVLVISPYPTVTENIIDGAAGILNIANKTSSGIFVNQSFEGTYLCNDINNVQDGMVFQGSGDDNSTVTTNVFRNHINGIKLTEDAITGQQQAQENRWIGSAGQTEGLFEFMLDINDPFSILRVEMSQFQINNANTNSVFWANPRLVGTIPNDGFWFVPDVTSTQIPDNAPISCILGGGSSSSRLSRADQFVLAGSFPLYRGFAATGWDAKFRLYDRISRETAVLAPTGSPAKNFYDTHSGSANLGTLYAAWKQASNFGVSTSATATQMNQVSEDISGILTQIDAIDISLSDANTSTAVLQSLKTQRDLLLTTYETKENILQTLSNQFTLTEKQAANTQLANLNSLTVTDTWEQNFKDVVSIVLSMEANSTNATSTQQATLQGIATQCQYAGGYGVLLARSLYQGYDTNKSFTDATYAAIDALCSGERTTPVEKGKNNVISVQPNPANDYLQVVINGDNTKGLITLTDITGRLVFETPTTGIVTPISTERLTNGIYYIVVSTEGQVSKTLKVVIAH